MNERFKPMGSGSLDKTSFLKEKKRCDTILWPSMGDNWDIQLVTDKSGVPYSTHVTISRKFYEIAKAAAKILGHFL